MMTARIENKRRKTPSGTVEEELCRLSPDNIAKTATTKEQPLWEGNLESRVLLHYVA